MKRISKITLMFTFIFALALSQFTYQPGKAHAESDLGLQAEASIIIDGKTGQIIYEHNADKVLSVASMSKMMTEYIVMESIKSKKITWDQKVNINEYVHNLSKTSKGASNIGLTQGEDYTVKELYSAMAVYSGNAATVALAELIAGSEKNFVQLMNEKAKQLGLKDYKFVNATGLNNADLLGHYPAGNATEENVMTARDTALLAYHLINDYPEVLDYSSISKLKFRGGVYPNFNFMLPGLTFAYEGVDGLKTGHTDLAGYAFTGTAIRNGQRYITVVMKSTSQINRFADTKKLMDYAFGQFQKEEILPANYQVKGKETIPVAKGKEKTVKVETKDALNLLFENGKKDNYKVNLVVDKSKLNKDGELTAPIKKGEKLGYLTVEAKDGVNYGYITNPETKAITVDVVAADDVEKANWFVLSMRAIGGFFGDIWLGAASTVKGWF